MQDFNKIGLDKRLRSVNSLANKMKLRSSLEVDSEEDRAFVTQYQLADDSVGTGGIADNSVSTAKIQNSAINAAKIASNAVDSTEVTGGAIDGTHVASGAVVGTHVASGAVVGTHVASGAIVGTHITNFDYEVGTGDLNATAGTADIAVVTGDAVRADTSYSANGTAGITQTAAGTAGTMTFTLGLLTAFDAI